MVSENAFALAILAALLCPSSAKFNPEGLMPTIIWWTDMIYPHPGKSVEIKCPEGGRCMSVQRRKKRNLEHGGAYLFYGSDIQGLSLPLPRLPGDTWALLHEESPSNNFLLSHSEGVSLFNLTATPSRSSHFPLTLLHLPSLPYLMLPPPPRSPEDDLAPLLYLQSHCGVASDRDTYVKELMRYIDVDSYGACLHNRDLPPHLSTPDTYDDEELFKFIARYKFHLAFENALCEDYITEKLFRALHVGSVPVYRGSPSVRDWAPSDHSVIVADDFSSPRELASYLNELDHNDTLYSEYLRYKEYGITNQLLKKTLQERSWGVNDPSRTDFVRGFECYVCDRIQSPLFKSVANRTHMNCHQPHRALFPEDEGQATISNKDHKMPDIPKKHQQIAFIPEDEGQASISNSKSHLNDIRPHQSTFIPEDEASIPKEERQHAASIPEDTCKSSKEQNGNCRAAKETFPDEWSTEDWEESFFFAYDEARAIHLMIQSGENDSSRFMHYLTTVKYPA